MQIEKLPGLEADLASRLRTIGIYNCRQLLRASRRQDQYAVLSQATDLPVEVLHSLIQRAELGQLQGIGPTTLEQLCELGIDSIASLASQEPAKLQVQLRQAADRPPNLAVIEDWIQQAQMREDKRALKLLYG